MGPLGLGIGLMRRAVMGGTPSTPAAPVITASSILGTAEDGETLTANYTRTGYPTPTMTFQWQNNGVSISGETGQTIVLNATGMSLADGDTISCEITATNSEGSDSAEPTIAFVVPTVITVSPDPVSVAENAAVGSIVATLTVENGSGTYTFLLTDGGEPNASALELVDIGGNQAELRVQTLDYEAHPTLSIAGLADNGTETMPFTFEVTVTDVVETPSGNIAPVLVAMGMI